MNTIRKRGIWPSIFLTFVTLGVYGIFWKINLVKNIRTIKGDRSSCTKEILLLLLVPFYYCYWWYSRGETMKRESAKRGYSTKGNGVIFLLLSLLGLEIVAEAIMQSDMNRFPCGNSFKTDYRLGVRASRNIVNIFVYILLVTMTLIWLFPFFGILMESFKVNTAAMDGELFPKKFGFDNYVRLFTKTSFLRWFLNTGFMGVATALLQTIFVLTMSYTLSRLRFKGRKALMNFMLILGMFPGFLTMILIYKVFYDFGLTEANAPIGLIIVYCASSGMGYYVSKGFFDTIPTTLDEAARVDGATRLQVLYKVILPLSKPIVIYTVLMGFMAPWGDFMMASYLAHEKEIGQNVAVGMFEWLSRANLNLNYTMFCAAGVVVALPVTAVFLMLQKYYVEGVTGGAVKG